MRSDGCRVPGSDDDDIPWSNRWDWQITRKCRLRRVVKELKDGVIGEICVKLLKLDFNWSSKRATSRWKRSLLQLFSITHPIKREWTKNDLLWVCTRVHPIKYFQSLDFYQFYPPSHSVSFIYT